MATAPITDGARTILSIGGAVKGRDIYGQFPVVAIGTNEDAGQGRFIPTTSVDQYAASFARWMGLSDAQLADVLPNLQYFRADHAAAICLT